MRKLPENLAPWQKELIHFIFLRLYHQQVGRLQQMTTKKFKWVVHVLSNANILRDPYPNLNEKASLLSHGHAAFHRLPISARRRLQRRNEASLGIT